MNWADVARLAADSLEQARAAEDRDDVIAHALVSIAASLYRQTNTSPAHPSRPRAVADPLDDYGVDPPESETERYWREKDEQLNAHRRAFALVRQQRAEHWTQ